MNCKMDKFKGTPGPWRWEFNEKSKHFQIVGGKVKYDLIVMDFVRYGMGGAAPRFNIEIQPDCNIMERAEKFSQIVPGREHHTNWFKTINHPDANLMVSAPELLEALQELLGHFCAFTPAEIEAKLKAEQAINKALNQTNK